MLLFLIISVQFSNLCNIFRYFWVKSNGLLDESQTNINRPDPSAGTLAFSELQVRDEGEYRCVAENAYGRAISNRISLRRAYLVVPAPFPPVRLQATQWEDYRLRCLAPSSYPPTIQRWVRVESQESEITQPVSLDERVHVSRDGKIKCRTCILENKLGRHIQHTKEYSYPSVSSHCQQLLY